MQHELGGSTFLRNIGKNSLSYLVDTPRTQECEHLYPLLTEYYFWNLI